MTRPSCIGPSVFLALCPPALPGQPWQLRFCKEPGHELICTLCIPFISRLAQNQPAVDHPHGNHGLPGDPVDDHTEFLSTFPTLELHKLEGRAVCSAGEAVGGWGRGAESWRQSHWEVCKLRSALEIQGPGNMEAMMAVSCEQGGQGEVHTGK